MPEPSAQDTLDTLSARARVVSVPCGSGQMTWRIWGDDGSAKPDLVLLHGGSGAWNHWVRNIPALEERWRVIAGDLPGCGDSTEPPRPYDGAMLADLVSQALDGVLPRPATFDLVSFSFGGVLSGLIAHAQASRIRSLTIVGSPILGLISTGKANELVAVPADLPPEQAAPLYRHNLEKLMVHDPAAVDDLAMTLHMSNMAKARLRSRGIARTSVLADSLRNLPCRLNCIFGENDVTLKPDLAGVRAYIEEIHPGARFHVVPGAGHWVQFEAPDAFNALLPRLLKSERSQAAD